jgi:hypothetical protein
MDIQIQDVQRTPSKTKTNNHIKIHYNQTVLSKNQKDNFEKQEDKNDSPYSREHQLDNQHIAQYNLCRLEGCRMIYSNAEKSELRILYLMKSYLKNEGEIKNFSNEKSQGSL